MKELLKIVCIIIASCLLHSFTNAQDKKSSSELRKLADEHFENKEFSKAKEYYSQLTTFFPRDPYYNYRFGACMLKVDSDKKFPLKYLEYAVSRPEVDAEAFFYLGRGYHLNYRFREAVTYYNQFKEKGSSKSQKELEVDQQITQCENGLKLLVNISEPKVLQRRKLEETNFYLSYRLPNIGVKYLKVPAELRSPYDNKIGFEPIMYRNSKSDTILFGSYGPDKDNGKDIYMVILREDGSTSEKIRLPGNINTSEDEDFPFLHPNGVDLFFASKGHNSMGGYDIFHSTYNAASRSWSDPENLDYAINTPDNDFMYVVDDSAGVVYFTSDRNNDFGKVTVFKINPERTPFQFSILSGVFSAENTNSATIVVQDAETKEEVGKYSSGKNDGAYLMRLKNGGKYEFLVEPIGSPVTYSGLVELPMLKKMRPLKQEMQIVKEGETERLVITNLFEEEMTEADEKLMAEELLRAANIGEGIGETEVEIQFVDIDLSNEEIVAQLDTKSKRLREESALLMERSAVAYELVQEKNNLVKADLGQIKQLETEIGTDSSSAENIKKLEELAVIKKDARVHTNEAAIALGFAQELEDIATEREQAASAIEDKLESINSAISSDDRKTTVELYQETEAIETAEGDGVDLAFKALKEKAEDKRKVAQEVHRNAEDLYSSEADIKDDISHYRGQANQTRDKQLKKSLEAEVEELELELEQNKTAAKLEMDRAVELEAEAQEYEKRLAVAEEIFNSVNSTLKPSLPIASVNKADLENEVVGYLEDTEEYDEYIEHDPNILAKLDGVGSNDSSDSSENGTIDGSDLVVESDGGNDSDTTGLGQWDELANSDVNGTNGTEAIEDIPVLIGGADFSIESSPYESTYESQLSDIASTSDEQEKLTAEKAIQQNWLSSINEEISSLQTEMANTPDATNKAQVEQKLARLESEASTKQSRIETLDQQLAAFEPVVDNIPSDTNDVEQGNDIVPEEYLAYNTVKDLEDKYFFEMEEAGKIADEKDRIERQNEIQQDYLNDIEVEKDGLKEEQKVLSSGDDRYKEIGDEIAALEAISGRKETFIAENTAKLAAIAGGGVAIADNTEVPGVDATNESTPTENPTTENTEDSNVEQFDPVELEKLMADASYQGEYKQLMSNAGQISDPIEKAESEQNVMNSWVNSIEAEIKTLENEKDDIEDEAAVAKIDTKIALLSEQKQDLETQSDDKKDEIKRLTKLAKAEAKKAEEDAANNVDLASNATEEATTDNTEEAANNASTENTSQEDSAMPTELPKGVTPSVPETNAELLAIATPKAVPFMSSVGGGDTEDPKDNAKVKAEQKKLQELNTQLDNAKKRKQKKALNAQIDEQIKKLARARAEAKVIYEKNEKIQAAEMQAINDPKAQLMSVGYADEVSDKVDAADLMEEEVRELENQLGETKKKKHRRKLEAQIAGKKDSASFARFEAGIAQQTLTEMEAAELNALKEGSAFGKQLVVEVPEYNANLSQEEINEVESSEAYKTYAKDKSTYERRIQEATVLYESADKKEAEAKTLLADADEILNGLDAIPEQDQPEALAHADQLRVQAKQLLQEAADERTEANTLNKDGFFTMNMANKKLVALENTILRDHIIAYTAGSFEKKDTTKVSGTGLADAAQEDDPLNRPKRKDPNDTRTVDATPKIITVDNVDVVPVNLTEQIFIKPAQQVAVYSEEKPIPVNTKMPDGVVFKVQVGAFRNPIPQETFKGFAPITGETTASGLMRYTAGLFKDFNKANGAKNEIRGMGYNDAFVVAYRDGNRISVLQMHARF